MRQHTRNAVGFVVLAILMAALFYWNINTGSVHLSLERMLTLLRWGNDGTTEGNILWKIRLSRLLGAALLGGALWLQILLFLAVSAVILALTRPLVKKMAGHVQPTNLDQTIGASARVTEDIDDAAGTGAVYVKGKMWTARSSSGATIPIGTEVTVERIEGVKLYVTPVRAEAHNG